MIKKLFLLLFCLSLVSCAAPTQKTQVTLLASDFTYEPASITVPAGQPVSLTIKNKGSVEHDFVVEKINIKDMLLEQDNSMDMHHDMADMNNDLHITTMPNQTSHVTFTPLKAGTYTFFCSVKGHKEAGMTGVMIVTE